MVAPDPVASLLVMLVPAVLKPKLVPAMAKSPADELSLITIAMLVQPVDIVVGANAAGAGGEARSAGVKNELCRRWQARCFFRTLAGMMKFCSFAAAGAPVQWRAQRRPMFIKVTASAAVLI